MTSAIPDSATTAADQVRRLSYLHDAVELYSRTSPSLASWLGLQFIERSHEDGVSLNDAVTRTICTKCGVLLVPAVTRSVGMHGKGKVVTVRQECTRCKRRVVIQGKVTKSSRDRMPIKSQTGGLQGSKRQQPANPSKAAPGSVAGPASAKANASKKAAVAAATSTSNAAKAPSGGKQHQQQQQLPGPNGKTKAPMSAAKKVDEKKQTDEDSASRRSVNKKKSTLRGLLSLQKKNDANSKSLSLTDFLSNL